MYYLELVHIVLASWWLLSIKILIQIQSKARQFMAFVWFFLLLEFVLPFFSIGFIQISIITTTLLVICMEQFIEIFGQSVGLIFFWHALMANCKQLIGFFLLVSSNWLVWFPFKHIFIIGLLCDSFLSTLKHFLMILIIWFWWEILLILAYDCSFINFFA